MSQNPLGPQAVIEALKSVNDPELHRDLVSLGMVKDVEVKGGDISLTIQLTTPACPLKDKIGGDVKDALAKLPGFKSVNIEFGAQVASGLPQSLRTQIPNIKNIIGVSAGKGGVGKTTVACNLAVALAKCGAQVGLLDADIHGPNVPIMMGVEGSPKVTNNKIQPMESHGVKVMSMGFLIDPDRPVIWRGPMLHKALTQFFSDVEWGEIDYLIVDLPPGTGDIQLSLFQIAKPNGVVIVATPQRVALADVRKGIAQWRQFGVEILGLIENMTGDVFGSGGGKAAAEELEMPFLGEIPLDTTLRVGSDKGEPVCASRPNSEIAKTFDRIAGTLAARVSVSAYEKAGAAV
jgi:ATP-binding protein involved in chromosome partitioning